MRQHCRCRKCQSRQVLAHPLTWYLREPRCRSCGEKALRADKWMNERRTSNPVRCSCDGYWFPHRAGSKWCNQNPVLLNLDPDTRPGHWRAA